MRFLCDVGGCRFPVKASGDASIGEASKLDVKESQFSVHFRFPRKLDPRVDVVEGLIEISRRVRGCGARAQSRASWEVGLPNGAENVIHIDAKVVRFLDATFISKS